ncbi:BAG-associated GRAM protein 1 isoform X1 [Selaginella moellendorffii]|uniref:BAG-associated GRAM protein 1 isoform X1 n=1 Tax=Selaginella moellendorffii TaxID=88036 RepID=UPI000D1C8BCA|nr:BAG-associated GRAM protein 1 isoform X1 [Selaginella moellendorffii]|eukprot:XP_024521275.1 BAG-associated GRAM protein 1 isoform X1 [Selaginella moellendorffii]
MRNVVEIAMQVLLPSWGEINVSFAAAVLVIFIFGVVRHVERLREAAGGFFLSAAEDFGVEGIRERELERTKENSSKVDAGSQPMYFVKLELLAAKNIAAANLNGTSDPYAVLTYGSQKRFSSLVPGSRNPMWGEEFDFYIDDLPAQIIIAIYDWDIIWKSTELGSTTIEIKEEGQTEAIWHSLVGTSGQVCVQTCTRRVPTAGTVAGTNRRRFLESPTGTEVRQKPGPLQTIFDLPPDEMVEHKFSCALERSFLYHGRMYVSAWHICFHSNVFAKQLKVVLPYDIVEEIKKSQHAFINPAITIILRAGTGGQGVPPLASPDGRAKYKFASFWNRNHAHRVLQRAVKNYQGNEEAAKQDKFMRVHSTRYQEQQVVPFVSSVDETTPIEETKVVQPFIKDDVLVDIVEDMLPCSAEQFFASVLSDKSDFTTRYRAEREDTELQIEPWRNPEEYSGILRKVTYRAKCNSPMCPPDTAMTDTQHIFFSGEKKLLHWESIQQAHDVPFGSSFEIHARWTVETLSESKCKLSVKVGTNFKKRLFMASKIRSGAESEYKTDAMKFIEIIKKGLKETGSTANDESSVSTPALEIPLVGTAKTS